MGQYIIKIWFASFLFVLSSCKNSNAQNESLRFEHLGLRDGISNTRVTTIYQDTKGYIWIGTFDGLNKYDGYTFTKYKLDPYDASSVSQNLIYTVFEDKDGLIWLSTYEGLCKFDRYTEKFTRYRPDTHAKFADPNILSISEDHTGLMWVVSASGGLCRFNKHTGKFLPDTFNVQIPGKSVESSTHQNYVTCAKIDRSGVIWVGTSAGLHLIKSKSPNNSRQGDQELKLYQYDSSNKFNLSSKIVRSIFEDRDEVLWITTSDGLVSLDKERERVTIYRHDPKNSNSINTNNFQAVFGNTDEDQDGNLWFSSGKGLIKLNAQRTAFTTYQHNPSNSNSLSSSQTSSILVDRGGVLWVGSLFGELNKANLARKSFSIVQNVPGEKNSLSDNNVNAILEDKSGIFWIGTFGGGLNRWDKKTNRFTHYRSDPGNSTTLRSDVINAIMEDRDGILWVANKQYLSRLNKQSGEFTHYNFVEGEINLSASPEIFSIEEDREGFIWLSTGVGVKRFDKKTGKFVKHYYHNKEDSLGISDFTAQAIFADSLNNIWIGYGSIATDKLNIRTDFIEHYKNNSLDTSSISSSIVNSFFHDSKGNLWLATSAGGLCKYNYSTNKFIAYTNKHGLAVNTVYSILEDEKYQLWLGTANGLSRFDPVAIKFINFNDLDGLQGREFTAGERGRSPAWKGKDGILYFGGANGFNFFNPGEIKTNNYLAPVVITQFKIFDSLARGANEKKEIVLQYNENYFSFEFSSLSFFNTEKNQYAYQLEGVDKHRVYSGTRRYVAYTDIGPGKYTFRVMATNSDGIWNDEGTTFTVVINPPWWRTWWAYLIYALLFMGGVLMIHRYQKQKVVRVEREKAQKKELEQAREIEKAYHDLKTTQQQLIHSEKMASLGELTAGIAHEIQNPLNFVNNFSEVNRELLEEMKDEIRKGNFNEVSSLADNVIDNHEKINHHGKRADSIVKGMLQHTKSSSAARVPTDINALFDEYLRLAYHGLRAKDKTFNAITKTDFEQTVGPVPVVPQEIGRVMLNLINNAFYAVGEKKKSSGDDYEPTVTISTKKVNDKIELIVNDNGNGIPQNIVEKIFQPFFTTKPTGQGTGLGLSLSYDIVKAHGGEISIRNRPGEGAEFVITLNAI